MKLSKLNILNTSKEMIDVFGGYNHNEKIGDGEFYDMQNLTSDNYPLLSVRKQRGNVFFLPHLEQPVNPIAIDCSNGLSWVDGKEFVNFMERIDMGLSDDLPKQLIPMGKYILIMPDKKYVSNSADWGYIEAYADALFATFTLCKSDGSDYGEAAIQETAPSEPENMALWIDTSSVPHTLKQYYEASDTWTVINSTYVKISWESLFESQGELSAGDGIKLYVIGNDELADFDEITTVIKAVGDNYIVIPGILDKVSVADRVIVRRDMPDIDYFCESGNRLWGVSKSKNEIYASKLGDFKNWNCFEGISTDSYVASVGTAGDFTGAYTYQGRPIFFKENCIHKIYGDYPSNFQMQTTTCNGVQAGCYRSFAEVNGVLYYKSPFGIYSYDGSFPTDISEKLGNKQYDDAVAIGFDNKYYISMSDGEKYHLFVYDTVKRMWHREDNTRFYDVGIFGESTDIFYLEEPGGKIKTMFRRWYTEDTAEKIKWMAETGKLDTDSLYKKYISRIDVRISLEFNTNVRFFIEYDSSGEWELVYTMTGERLQSFSIPLRTRRCDHLRLRIEGEGEAKIYSICKTIEQGSDI